MADIATFPGPAHHRQHSWLPTKHQWLYVVGIVFFLAAIVAGIWYFVDMRNTSSPSGSSGQSTTQNSQGGSSSSGNSSGGSSGTQQGPGNGNQTPQPYSVLVYFSKHPESDNDPGMTFAVRRTSSTLGVGSFAITELLKGPTATEADRGYFTTARLRNATSTCGGADFTLAIKDGTATLQFCKPFDHLGVVADGQADSEIKATLKQFPTVQKVVVLNYQGNCEFDLSGLNLCLKQ